jgi:hypothetical protein
VREALINAGVYPLDICDILGIDPNLDLDTHRLVALPAEIAEHLSALLWVAACGSVPVPLLYGLFSDRVLWHHCSAAARGGSAAAGRPARDHAHRAARHC